MLTDDNADCADLDKSNAQVINGQFLTIGINLLSNNLNYRYPVLIRRDRGTYFRMKAVLLRCIAILPFKGDGKVALRGKRQLITDFH